MPEKISIDITPINNSALIKWEKYSFSKAVLRLKKRSTNIFWFTDIKQIRGTTLPLGQSMTSHATPINYALREKFI